MGEPYALMKNAKGQYVIGCGAYSEYEQCPSDETAFFINDFSLGESKPWKVFEKTERHDVFPVKQVAPISCSWEMPNPEGFTQVFSEVTEAIASKQIEKSVPVVTEYGKLLEGKIEELIFSVQPDPVYNPYAWHDGEVGFCGLTPEVLFSYEKGRLRTMALAGTADLADKSIFSVDQKEIKEHEFVAQTLISKLNEVGMVQPESRRIMELNSLVHFYTPIFVGLYDAMPMEALIHRLHPTPALGPLPRNEKSMNDLEGWRNRLDCPEHFGAPMGLWDQGEFHAVVCIRGVYWNGEKIKLPSGCGVIEPSRLTNEWRELQLKRESVKSLFGL